MLKRFLLYILIFVSILIGFVYFTKPPQKEKNTVVFWTLQLGTFEEYINNIIDEFENNNPEVKIKWVDVPYSEGEKRTLAAIMTDNPPDLINLTPDFSLLLAQKKALYDIPSENLCDFIPALKATLKYNDKYFGIPFYATSAVTLVNMSLTDKYNIYNYPKTYDELFSINFDSNSDYLTMINLAENDTLLKILNKYDINSPNKINEEKSLKLFNLIKNAYDKNLIPKESLTQSHRDSLEKYMSGQLIFLVTGANFINMIKENAPIVYKNTKILNQLVGDTKCYDYSLMNLVIPQKAKNKESALKFALFLTNEKNQVELSKLTTILPANSKALNNKYFIDSITNDVQFQARIISAKQLGYLQQPLKNIKNKKELNTLSSNYIQEILIKNKNIKATLDKFKSDWENLER